MESTATLNLNAAVHNPSSGTSSTAPSPSGLAPGDIKSEVDSANSNRPPASRFHQQKLPAWQPLLTAGTVFPLFLFMALIFLGMGVALLMTNSVIVEHTIDYTYCRVNDTTQCSSLVETPEYYANYKHCQCTIEFSLKVSMSGKVYAYYALTNFHQNHRKYVKSHDGLQLSGRIHSNLDQECNPYRQLNNGSWIAPCGSVANSLFNDTFLIYTRHSNGSLGDPVPWTRQGISWPDDVRRKYGRVANTSWAGTIKPPNWPVSEYERSPEGYTGDEELQVWMSVAALPSFRKLHRRVLHESGTPYANGLPSGDYVLMINYSYPVTGFGGTKAFVLSTAGILGGKNAGLGGLSVAVGCLHLALCCLFAVLHFHAKRSREVDPYYGMDPSHRVLLETMTAGVSPMDNASDDEDIVVHG